MLYAGKRKYLHIERLPCGPLRLHLNDRQHLITLPGKRNKYKKYNVNEKHCLHLFCGGDGVRERYGLILLLKVMNGAAFSSVLNG